MKTKTWLATGCGVALAALVAVSPARADEVVLSAISFLPQNLAPTEPFLDYIEDVNAQGKGVVQIEYRGGPEVVPSDRQAQAVTNGVVDILYSTPGRFAGVMPEGDALLGATRSLQELRENGGIEMLDKRMQERMRTHLLGVFLFGTGYYVYLTDEPKFDEAGMPDLSGVPVRTSATYREFLDKLGANNISVSSSEIYTALERGLVSGMAWPEYGLLDLGVQKFLNYRIDPTFFNANNVVMINQRQWDSLSEEAKDLLTRVALEHETKSTAYIKEDAQKEADALKEGGMEFVPVQVDAELYQARAAEVVWERLAERAPDTVEAFKKLYFEAPEGGMAADGKSGESN